MKAKFGCLLGLLLIGAMSVELWFFLVLATDRWVQERITVLGLVIALALALFVGIKLARRNGGRIMAGLLTGGAGPALVGTIGGVLLAFPGFLSDIPGILLLLPPVQRLFGALATKVAMSIARNAMSKMMGGGGFPGMPPGGFPGGFPGMPPGGFPGGPFPGMKPDDRVRRPPRTIDTTVEKD